MKFFKFCLTIILFITLQALPGSISRFSEFVSGDNDPRIFVGRELYSYKLTDEQKNYLVLMDLYRDWKAGLFGSRKVNERKLKLFLIDLIGKNIETDKSFTIESPGAMTDKIVKCKLLECRWLNLHGNVDVSEIKDLVKDDPALLLKWWRSGILFMVSGKVRKFRLGRNKYGDTIELFLYNIKIHKP